MYSSNRVPRPYVVTLRCDGASRTFKVDAYEVMEAVLQAGVQASASGVREQAMLDVRPDVAALIQQQATEDAARKADVRAIVRNIGGRGTRS